MTRKDESRKLIKSKSEELFDNSRNIFLEWATGCGKSFAAINLQARMNSQKTFICVAESAHIQNWKDEYIKHGYESLLETTEIFCYASLKKYANKSCNLLILDEAHHLFSQTRMFLITLVGHDRAIGLSATISNEQWDLFQDILGSSVKHSVSMEEAIDMGILSKPKVFLISLGLDNYRKSEIIEYNRGRNIKEIHCDYLQSNSYIYNRKLYPTLNLKIHCTQKEKYDYLNAQYEAAKARRSNGWLRYGGIRKKFLSDCKTSKLMEMTKNLSMLGKRFICFCGSIEQAEILGKDKCIHSKKDAKKVIEKFNKYEINSLYAVGMLQEGQNLPGIEVAIIGQLDGTERPFIQKSGRGIRAEFPEIYVLYFENTKDLDYLKNVTENIPEEYLIKL